MYSVSKWSIEKSFCGKISELKSAFEIQSFTEQVTERLMKFEKKIDRCFSSLGKLIANSKILSLQTFRCCRLKQVLKRNWLNSNMIGLQAMCFLRNNYVNFCFMMCNLYKKLLHFLYKHCCCFHYHSNVNRHFKCAWKLEIEIKLKHQNVIFFVLLLMFYLISISLLLKSKLIHVIVDRPIANLFTLLCWLDYTVCLNLYYII